MGRKKSLEGHQLYYFATCPFCIKVLLSLWKMRLRVPLMNIHRHTKYKQQLEEGGGKVQVPCLRIEKNANVTWLYESDDIIQYFQQYR